MAKGKAAKQPAPNGQQPTAALEWRKAREVGELVPLPSGKMARLRPVDLLKMIRKGDIPNLLSPIAAKAVWSEQDTDEIGNSLGMSMEYYDLVCLVLPTIFVSPEIVDSPEDLGDDKILLDDVDPTDRLAAFNLAISGVSAMRQFRKQQEQYVDAVPDSDENGDTAE